MNKNQNQDKGFTLVELLIVIVILGILATVTVFAVRGITDKGQQNACSVETRTLTTAIESYYAQNQADPATIDDLTIGPITNLPNPGDRDTTANLLQDTPQKFTFYAAGDAIPADNGPDGAVGGGDDNAAVAAGASTEASFRGTPAGDCAGY